MLSVAQLENLNLELLRDEVFRCEVDELRNLKHTVGKALSRYMGIVLTDGKYVFYYRHDDVIHEASLETFRTTLSGINFFMYGKDIQQSRIKFKLPTRKRPKNGEDEQVDPVNAKHMVSVADFMSQIHLLAYPLLFMKLSFAPCGIRSPPERPDVMSLWRPGPYFLLHPVDATRHGRNFCIFLNFFHNYDGVVDLLLYDPLYKFSSHCEELSIIEDIMMMIFCLCQKNAKLFRYVLLWIAYVMYSGKKAQVALHFISNEQGIGKSTLASLIKALMGSNATTITSVEIQSKFCSKDYMYSQLLICEELRPDFFTKNLAKLKGWITDSNFTMEQKMKDTKVTTNYSSFLFTSNWEPESVEEADRRFIFIKSDPFMKKEDVLLETEKRKLLRINRFIEDKHTPLLDAWSIFGPSSLKTCKSAGTSLLKSCDDCKNLPFVEKRNPVKGLLSLYFLRLLLVNPTFEPYVNTPITKYHMSLFYKKNNCMATLWRMIQAKSNTSADPDNFMCQHPACMDCRDPTTHFDPDVKNWQTRHVLFPSIFFQDDYNEGEFRKDCESYGVDFEYVVRKLWYMYTVPVLAKLQQLLISKSDISSRELVD
jgi:hypothetical protein